jgi:hypothetical protein
MTTHTVLAKQKNAIMPSVTLYPGKLSQYFKKSFFGAQDKYARHSIGDVWMDQ